MPLPPVEDCILCEDVRPEPGNKASILGFYGILPRAAVVISPDEGSVKLTFLVIVAEGSGQYVLQPHIFSPDKSLLISGERDPVHINPEAGGTGLWYSFMGVRFTQDGEYFFQLDEGNNVVYRSAFNIVRGVIPIFKKPPR